MIKAINLGLPKTGTMSLHKLLKNKGVSCVHDFEYCCNTPISEIFNSYDIVQDGNFDQKIREIVDVYRDKDVLFFYTYRDDIESWINSALIHCVSERVTRGDKADWKTISCSDLRSRWARFQKSTRWMKNSGIKCISVNMNYLESVNNLMFELGLEKIKKHEIPKTNSALVRLEKMIDYYYNKE